MFAAAGRCFPSGQGDHNFARLEMLACRVHALLRIEGGCDHVTRCMARLCRGNYRECDRPERFHFRVMLLNCEDLFVARRCTGPGPEDIDEAVIFLCDRRLYREVIVVDGGRTLA